MKSEYERLRQRRLVPLFCTQKGEDMSFSSSIWFLFDAKWLIFLFFSVFNEFEPYNLMFLQLQSETIRDFFIGKC
jgi:asparagine synthetase B (glutamine-hydrolysing)